MLGRRLRIEARVQLLQAINIVATPRSEKGIAQPKPTTIGVLASESWIQEKPDCPFFLLALSEVGGCCVNSMAASLIQVQLRGLVHVHHVSGINFYSTFLL